MIKHTTIFALALLATSQATTAHAQQRSMRAAVAAPITCDDRGCSDRRGPQAAQARHARASRAAAIDAHGNAVIMGGRPAGCPYNFCGCEASLYLFGKIRPELNLAANWIKKFPRSAPAPGMAAARSGHVMVLMSHVAGDDWLVHDGNSGGKLTRRHVRSIRGYVIVNPHGSRAEGEARASRVE
ncbi:MAG: hypothetical protein ACK4UO_20170 [Pseudolabrys sp.]